MREEEKTPKGHEEPDMLTVSEFAEFARVAPWTIYEAIKRDEIPGAVKFGQAIRIHQPTALRWITGRPDCASESGVGKIPKSLKSEEEEGRNGRSRR